MAETEPIPTDSGPVPTIAAPESASTTTSIPGVTVTAEATPPPAEDIQNETSQDYLQPNNHTSNPPSPVPLGDMGQSAPSYQFISLPISPATRSNRNYVLKLRQQPKHSRMCGFGEKVDRRPVDPPPIIQMEISAVNSPEDAAYLFNPYFFMYASLISPDSEEELHLLRDGKTRSTTGSIVSSLYRLKDLDGRDGAFFVFPDLSVRMEGAYRLKFSLFEIVNTDIFFCTSVLSDIFHVYPAKKFPGMEESTLLSRTFAEQGLKIRIRKELRLKNEGKNKRNADDSSPDRRKRARNREDSDDGTESDDESNVVSRESKTNSKAPTPAVNPAQIPATPTPPVQVLAQPMVPPGYPGFYGRYYPAPPHGAEMSMPPPQGYPPYGVPPKPWGPHDPYAPHPYMRPPPYDMHVAPNPYAQHLPDPSQQPGTYPPHMPPHPHHYAQPSTPADPSRKAPQGSASGSSATGNSTLTTRSPSVQANSPSGITAPPLPGPGQWAYHIPPGYPAMYPPYPMNPHGIPAVSQPPQPNSTPSSQPAATADRRDIGMSGRTLPPIDPGPGDSQLRRPLPSISNGTYPGSATLPSAAYHGAPNTDLLQKSSSNMPQTTSTIPPPSPSENRPQQPSPYVGHHQQPRSTAETSSSVGGTQPGQPAMVMPTYYPPQPPYGDPAMYAAQGAPRPPMNHTAPNGAPQPGHPVPGQHMYPPHMYYYPPPGGFVHPGMHPPMPADMSQFRPGMPPPPYGPPRPPYPYDPQGQQQAGQSQSK